MSESNLPPVVVECNIPQSAGDGKKPSCAVSVDVNTIPPDVPKVLWIGCSDARVPESVMCPRPKQGDVFVHRNIANQFHLTDPNVVSVLTYGVTGITNNPITEVRVVGHIYCGGVEAAFNAATNEPDSISPSSTLGLWLGPLRLLAEAELQAVDSASPPRTKEEALASLTRSNIQVQVENVKTMLRWLGRSDLPVRGYLYKPGACCLTTLK